MLAATPHAPSPEGPGDDAAIVDGRVVTTDAFVEGTHFLRAHPPELLAHKVVYASASDVSAMGATPAWLTLAAALPADLPDAYWEAFARGLGAACRTAGLTLVGGDTVRSSGPLMLSLTVVGDAPARPLLRSGARPGDTLLCRGPVGRSGHGLRRWLGHARGLSWLPAARDLPASVLDDPCVRHHLAPTIPLDLGLWAAQQGATAALDLSDGLATDLPRLALASSVDLVVDLGALPVDAAISDLSPADRAASGEDFGLCVLAPPELVEGFAQRDFVAIGEAVEKAEGRSSAAVIFRVHGRAIRVEPSFAH